MCQSLQILLRVALKRGGSGTQVGGRCSLTEHLGLGHCHSALLSHGGRHREQWTCDCISALGYKSQPNASEKLSRLSGFLPLMARGGVHSLFPAHTHRIREDGAPWERRRTPHTVRESVPPAPPGQEGCHDTGIIGRLSSSFICVPEVPELVQHTILGYWATCP